VPIRPARRQIVALAALSAFGPLSLDMYLPGLPSLTRELRATASAGQLTITACMLGLGVGQLIAGPLSDARGRRGTLLTGIFAYAVASVACAAAPTVGLLVTARFVQGMAGGFGIVVARAIVRDLSGGATAARMFALLMGITGVVPVLAPLIGGQVLLITSWRGVFVVLAALGVPLFVATAVILPETLPASERHRGGLRTILGTFGRLLGDRTFSPYALAFALSFAAMFAYIAGSSFVLEDIYHLSPQLFSLVFAVNSAALIALSLVSGRLVGRIGATVLLRRGLFGTFAASLCTLLVVVTHAGLGWLLACFFVLLAANGLVLPNGTAAAMGGGQPALGAASALLGLGQFGLGALVAPLVGLAGSHDALPMAVVIAVAGTAAITVDLIFAPRGVTPATEAR
jgi:DHA1 family bicyclomycin/chloramphenicol resistance-like MFS transporter